MTKPVFWRAYPGSCPVVPSQDDIDWHWNESAEAALSDGINDKILDGVIQMLLVP
jgi:hypothetical protein